MRRKRKIMGAGRPEKHMTKAGAALADRIISGLIMICCALIAVGLLCAGARGAETLIAEAQIPAAYHHIRVSGSDLSRNGLTWLAYFFFAGIGVAAWCRVSASLTWRGFLSWVSGWGAGAVAGGAIADYLSEKFPLGDGLLIIGIAAIGVSFCICAIMEWLSQGDNRGKFIAFLLNRLTRGRKDE